MKYIFLCVTLLLSACSAVKNPPKTVTHVDLSRYTGTWYEIASFPNSFQKGCRCTQATYQLTEKGLSVVNKCRRGKEDRYDVATGRAWLADASDASNSKLKVQFFWPFRGNYWILALDPNYKIVLVGNPRRNYLWILARTRTISAEDYLKYKNIAKEKGYDVSKLRLTNQKNCERPKQG